MSKVISNRPLLTNILTIHSVQKSLGINSVSDLWTSFCQENEKRKRDPHTPALRSKGEKARNRGKRKFP